MIRILEISRIPLFKFCFPQETTWFSLGDSLIPGDAGCVTEQFTARTIWRLIRDLRRGAYDVVMLPAVEINYHWDANRIKRWIRRSVSWCASTKLVPVAINFFLRLDRNVIVFTDVSDNPALSYEVCLLAPSFLCYFKREFQPELTFRHGPRYEAINAKVHASSLFLPAMEELPAQIEKKNDLFFSGHLHNPVRAEGIRQVEKLRELGCKVDISVNRLTYPEYVRRMAEAWLVWSPEGYGWDCYRHYEAGFAGTVPVINQPAASRSVPFRDGTHCFYYRPGGDDLTRVVVRALEDKARLREIAAQAHEVVLASYTRAAIVARMQTIIVQEIRSQGRASRLLEGWA